MRISWNFTGVDGDILGYHQLLWLMDVPQFMARLMQNMMICSMDLGVPYVKTNPKRKLPPNEDQKGVSSHSSKPDHFSTETHQGRVPPHYSIGKYHFRIYKLGQRQEGDTHKIRKVESS